VEDISGQEKDATRGERFGGALSRPGILEHSKNGTNSKHEKSSLVHITRTYKISALTPLVLNCLHAHAGPGNRNEEIWKGKFGE